ncbi:unnamed protein product, partial [Onchocerca flexuosa]|uniref:Nonstructural protein n=1 Tax=Onchocerca flexuosa TaxID=387005 RepID=A0A183H6J2_9BILA
MLSTRLEQSSSARIRSERNYVISKVQYYYTSNLVSYLAVIIVGVIGTLILLTVMTMCLCKNLSFCPMNAAKSTCSTTQHAQQHYRPIDTLSTKPVTYE